MIYIILLCLFLLTVIFILILFFLFLIRDNYIADVPFIPVKARAVKQIVSALQLKAGDVLYDLGSGDGRVLIEAIENNPGVIGVGVENGLVPFIISRLRTRKMPIRIHFQNIFKADMSKATHIYFFLSTTLLAKLEKKIYQECKVGTRIVSCDFQFAHSKPVEIISLVPSKDKLSHSLYVYIV